MFPPAVDTLFGDASASAADHRPHQQGPNVSPETSRNPEPTTTPDGGVEGSPAPTLIERVVASPVSRSAYASVVVHVLLGILLDRFVLLS